jgi:hypothetical protein
MQDGDGARIRRARRDLARLEALRERQRLRRRVGRGLRGLAGAGGTLLALAKMKVAASLGAKLLLAVLVGLGLAWPAWAFAVFLAVGFVVALAALPTGEGDVTDLHGHCDWPFDCRRKRAARLARLIADRRAWLARAGVA